MQQLAQKIGDIEQEAEEHKYVFDIVFDRSFEAHYVCRRLVIDTLEPLPKDRKCFRLINGVLVERTIEDVIPSLRTNADGLKKVLEELMKQYKARQEEMDKWKVGSSIQCPRQAFADVSCSTEG